jgi:hypothetical protein
MLLFSFGGVLKLKDVTEYRKVQVGRNSIPL